MEEDNSNKSKWRRIELGEEEDDFTNHFLSHFGFYEDNRALDVDHRRRLEYEANIKIQKL